MLNLDGMAASIASIESALYVITTNESIGTMYSKYNQHITGIGTIIVLAKPYRVAGNGYLLEQIMHQLNALSMCVAKNCPPML